MVSFSLRVLVTVQRSGLSVTVLGGFIQLSGL